MRSKSSSFVSGNSHGYSHTTRRENRLGLQADREPVLGTPDLPSLVQRFVLGTQTGPPQNEDYDVALIPRQLPAADIFLRRPATKDQFLFLPLTWRELLGKLEENIKRSQSSPKKLVEFGEVRVNYMTMEVIRSERLIPMTKQQFKLLQFMTQSPEQVFSREELLNHVWGYHHYPTTRTVDNHILVLRRKLEPSPARPVHFLTVHGIGYKFILRARE